jgi:hypothetical protein
LIQWRLYAIFEIRDHEENGLGYINVIGHLSKMEEVKERLKKYTLRNYKELLIAAQDNLLPTLALIDISKEIIIAERKNKVENTDYLPLMILHLRSNEDTLNKSLDLLESSSPVDRQLGCSILREFPRLDEQPTKFSEKIISSMSLLIEKEKDEYVIVKALSTIGWQKLDIGHEILLRMSSDPRANVRYVVANNLLMVLGNNQKVTEETARVFLKFAKDPDEDIRSSIFWDIAEYPDIFSDFKE